MNAERMSWVMNMDAENYVLSCEKGTRFEAFVLAVLGKIPLCLCM